MSAIKVKCPACDFEFSTCDHTDCNEYAKYVVMEKDRTTVKHRICAKHFAELAEQFR